MKNILFNSHLLNFKNFVKSGRNLVSTIPLRHFSNSLLRCHSVSECSSKGKKSLRLSCIRCVSTSVTKFEKVTENDTKEKNGSRDVSIVYSGTLTHMVKGVKVFTCTTTLGGIFFQTCMLKDSLLTGKDLPIGVALLSCVGFFTFVTPYICHLLTRRYVTEIWYNSLTETYTATLLSFFLRRINIDFKIEDVTVLQVPVMFSTVSIKGQPVFIANESFLEMEHFIKMMKYDKPLDFKVNSPVDLAKSESKEKTEIM